MTPRGYHPLMLVEAACPRCGRHLGYGVGMVWADDGSAGVYSCSKCDLTYEDRDGKPVRRDGAVLEDGEL